MKKQSLLFTPPGTISARFFRLVLFLALLFIVCVILLFLWGFFPDNRLFPAAAAVLGVWLAAGGLLISRRIYRRLIQPLEELEEFADRLARGEFPAPLKNDGTRRNAFPNLVRSLNLLRDRLQSADTRLRSSRQQEDHFRTGDGNGELRSQILTRMLPDMRIPLNALAGYEYLLKTRPDAPEREEWIAAIGHNLHTTERLLERLLDIGALGAQGNRDRIESPFDLTALIRQLTEYNTRYLLEKDVTLVKRFSSDAPEELVTDRALLFQLLTILIRAVGHTAAPGNSVEISCEHDLHNTLFKIREIGPVVRKNPLAEWFHAYRRNHQHGTPPERVILGLLFVETQAATINGRLEVHEKDTAELCLVLEEAAVPQHVSAGAGAIRFANTTAGLHHTQHPSTGNLQEPRRLLLLDANRDFAAILCALLPKTDIRTLPPPDRLTEYPSPAEYDAVLIALGASGFHARTPELEKFLSDAVAAQTAVFILVNDQLEQYRRHLSLFPGMRVLQRPVNYPQLLQSLREIAGSRPAAQP